VVIGYVILPFDAFQSPKKQQQKLGSSRSLSEDSWNYPITTNVV